MKVARFPVHLGVVVVGSAIATTLAKPDVSAVFWPRTIEATHADMEGALAELASELRTIADSVDGAAQRLREGKL